MGEIRFERVSKSFGNVKVIEDLNLTIKDGEFTVLVGASGCGKTTLLRMIAGIGPATSGQVFIDGVDVSDVPPGKRDIAMVFQNYAIYPTMTVKGNIEFGLVNNKVPKAERERLITDVAETVGLTPYLKRKPSELSGGQRQRVALARAMVKKPSVFLLDEPLSNLDAKLRVSMRSELIELHHRLKATFVYVTHDQTEAMSMADTVVLMRDGAILQKDSPVELYNNPNCVYVAQFVGTPPMNVLPFDDGFIGYRPEAVSLGRPAGDGLYYAKGVVLTREILGSETNYKIALASSAGINQDSPNIMVKTSDYSFNVDDPVDIFADSQDLYFFDKGESRVYKSDEGGLYEQYMNKLSRA